MLEDLKKFLEKEKIPCFIFMMKDKEDKPKFIEVIVKRPYRYTEKGIMKKIPKTWEGVKIKIL